MIGLLHLLPRDREVSRSMCNALLEKRRGAGVRLMKLEVHGLEGWRVVDRSGAVFSQAVGHGAMLRATAWALEVSPT